MAALRPRAPPSQSAFRSQRGLEREAINTSAPAAAFSGAVGTRDLGRRNRDVTPSDCPLSSGILPASPHFLALSRAPLDSER